MTNKKIKQNTSIVALLFLAIFIVSPVKALDPWTDVSDATLTNNSFYNTAAMISYNGNLYATGDSSVARVLEYDGSSWTQINTNDFGNSNNSGGETMAVYNGNLYAGTSNSTNGGQVWEYNGSSWTQVNVSGFGSGWNDEVMALGTYNGNLYAGTRNSTTGSEIWRYNGGTSWTQIGTGGFGDSGNSAAYSLESHNGNLYVGFGNGSAGAEIWEYDGSNFNQVSSNGFGYSDNNIISEFAVFDDQLYVGIEDEISQVYRYDGGTTWTQVNTDGFEYEGNNTGVYGLEVYNGKLYASVWENNPAGTEVWEYDGSTWTQVNTDGFGLTGEVYGGPFAIHNGYLYASSAASIEGPTDPHVWRSYSEPPVDPEEPEPEEPTEEETERDLSVDMDCEITCEEIICEVEAENEGDEDLEDIEVTIRLPEEVEFVDTEASSAWDCDYSENSRKVDCDREKALSSGEDSEIKVKLNVLDPSGEIKISSTIDYDGDGSESSDSNNKDSDRLKVDGCDLRELPVTGGENINKSIILGSLLMTFVVFTSLRIRRAKILK